MKIGQDLRLLERLTEAQRGVFSTSDLETAFAERHHAGFVRRVRALEATGVLRRFIRGWYVTESFDLPTLSQRIAPESYVSFETVLAKQMIVGTRLERTLRAVKVGKARTYAGLGYQIEHVGVSPQLYFGHAAAGDGVRYADVEKAVLDTLYFHLRGVRFVLDIYSDLAFDKLDAHRLVQYLKRYRNPKFVVFAKRVLDLPI